MSKSIFIDIKEGELNAYIFEVKQGRYEIKDSKRCPLSDSYNFSIDGMSEDIQNAYLSLPLSSLNFRVIDLPFSDKDKIREVLPFELDGMILGGSDKVVFDAIVIGTSGDKYQVLAVEEIKKPTINLRRDEFSYTRDIEKTKKSLKLTAVLMILLALVLSADLVLKIVSTRQEIASLKNDMRKTYQGIFPGEKNIQNELYQLKSHMKEFNSKEAFFVAVTQLSQ